MYVRDSCDVEILKCPVIPHGNLEFICARVMRDHSPPVACITVNRPPKGNTKMALQNLRAITDYVSSFKGEILVCQKALYLGDRVKKLGDEHGIITTNQISHQSRSSNSKSYRPLFH